MPRTRDPLLWRLGTVLKAAENEIMIIPHFTQRGRVWVCEHVAVMNEQTRRPSADVGVCHAGFYTWYSTEVLADRDQWQPFHFNVTLFTDHRVAIRWRDCSIGDHVHATISGYIREPHDVA